jgi:hypothetical protein
MTGAAGAQLDCLTAAADHYAVTGDAFEAARLRAALDDRGD